MTSLATTLTVALLLALPTALACLDAPADVSGGASADAGASASERGAEASTEADADADADAHDADDADAPALPEAPAPPILPALPPAPDVPALPSPGSALGPWGRASMDKTLEGAEVSGRILLQGTAEAEEGFRLAGVAVYVDDQPRGYANGSEAWAFPLDTRTLVDGEHTVRACGYGEIAALPWGPRVGACDGMRLSTLNHAPSVVLFERAFSLSGAGADAWIYVLDQDYTGLRVTFEYAAAPNATLPAKGLVEVSYAQAARVENGTEDAWVDTGRGWIATYGELEGSASWTHAPYGVVARPGALHLTGQYVGEGSFTVRVEAVPLSASEA